MAENEIQVNCETSNHPITEENKLWLDCLAWLRENKSGKEYQDDGIDPIGMIRAALKQARNEAREEAAKMVEEGPYMSGDPIAEDIRELKEE